MYSVCPRSKLYLGFFFHDVKKGSHYGDDQLYLLVSLCFMANEDDDDDDDI